MLPVTEPLPEPAFLTFKQVAVSFNLSERTVRRIVDKHELRPVRVGKKLLFPRSEVDRWIAAKLAERPSVEASAP